MLELSPEEVEAYLRFFPRFEEAVQKGWAARNPRASKPISALKALETLDVSVKREYERARAGEVWFNIGLYGRIKQELNFANLDSELQADVELAAIAHNRISKNFKYGRNQSWGAASFSRAARKDRSDGLFGKEDRKELFSDKVLFENFASRTINRTASGGNQGEAINNAYILAEYMSEERGKSLSFLSPSAFADRLLRITRAGAWVSQSVGQWYRFSYFKSKTEKLVAENHAQAGIVQLEHARHWERRNRLINNAPDFGSASKALALAIEQYGATSDLIDPVLYLNAADEFLDRGYRTTTSLKDLGGMNMKELLGEADARLRSAEYNLGLDMSRRTLTASRLMNDGDYQGAERQIAEAILKLPPDLSGGAGQIHRGLRLVRGKIALLRGEIDNEYLESSRQICLSMGAFHKVREIDRLRQLGDIERPS